MILEKDVESYFRRQVEKRGGLSLKWVSPGTRGVPDQIVFFPNGRTATVEMKKPGGQTSKSQKKMAAKLRDLNQTVWECLSKGQADELMIIFEDWGWFDHES